MQARSHAAAGARSIGAIRHVPAWGDAFASTIQLVGSTTFDRPSPRQEAEEFEQSLADGHPVEMARAWLQHPARRAALSADVHALAEATLVVAAEHFRDLNDLAGEVANDAAVVGVLDEGRMERVDAMAEVLSGYATTLRVLLDPTSFDAADATRRLESGLAAATHGGGLPALVHALARR